MTTITETEKKERSPLELLQRLAELDPDRCHIDKTDWTIVQVLLGEELITIFAQEGGGSVFPQSKRELAVLQAALQEAIASKGWNLTLEYDPNIEKWIAEVGWFANVAFKLVDVAFKFVDATHKEPAIALLQAYVAALESGLVAA